ncbi:N-acetylmuramic acid 6-phosphate etherase [Naumannella cuiyingiana]|uniref:N-acetylmuramic acid 6-phosphate etherase n=1 Tax=Naumannella cuiyingiana TaxID=1347891 RepID=A0A7Z0IKA1_9ACTN|nr:N-acetylmuramic acid 6-phosphate etherase [Naumannella cuiyingiana]
MYSGIDLGKTGCRLAVVDERPVVVSGPGAPGLAEPGGIAEAVRAVLTVREALPAAQRQLAGSLVCGAAGAAAAPEAAAELAARLEAELPGTEVTVTSDAVIAHAGALGGRSGTVAALGTGAVVINVSARGELRIFDGWGPWLGDDGSGAWLGREALRRVLASREADYDLGPLLDAARARFGDLARLPRTLAASGTPARATAAFAPDVLGLAAEGDAAARELVTAAAEALAGTIERAGDGPVAVTGGLSGSELLLAELAGASGREVVRGEGTPLDGALLLASGAPAPHREMLIGPAAEPGERSEVSDGSVDRLGTEQVRRDLADLDTFSSTRLVDVLLDAEASVPAAMRAAHGQLATAARMAAEAYARGGRIVYVGAGTPGRLGALDAAEIPPTYGVDPGRFVALLAGGEQAMTAAIEGAEDDEEAARADIERLAIGPADLVIGIAASGRTPYVVAALTAAAERGAPTVGITNNHGTAVAAAAEVGIELLTGPEVVSGSTRMKAGTSQKIALNIISTAAMIMNNKTYGAWMVDVAATNDKLRARANRIVREATGHDHGDAERALAAAGGEVKTAIVSLLTGGDAEAARERLGAADGSVRKALEDDQQQDQQDEQGD